LSENCVNIFYTDILFRVDCFSLKILPCQGAGSQNPELSKNLYWTEVKSNGELGKVKTKVFTVRVRDYYDIYYASEDIAIKSIKELPGDVLGVKIVLFSPAGTVSHFLYSTGDGNFHKLKNNAITASFVDNDQIQENTCKLNPVFRDNRKPETYTINIRCATSKFYASQKMTGHPHIIMLQNEPVLNVGTGSVDNWIINKPTAEEKRFVCHKWGKMIKGGKSNYDKAKMLAKTLMHDLWPHSGFPSDAMAVSPFKQYERMVSGKDKGYCSNFAAIFVCACNALGIPARNIRLSEIYYNRLNSAKCKRLNMQIQGGSCHGTTEIFDEVLTRILQMRMEKHMDNRQFLLYNKGKNAHIKEKPNG
jgi:hypothetical protein